MKENMINKVVCDARSRAREEKGNNSDEIKKRKDLAVNNIVESLTKARVQDEQLIFSVVNRAESLRVSQTEALAELVARGIYDETPEWWEVKDVFKGYVRPFLVVVSIGTVDGLDIAMMVPQCDILKDRALIKVRQKTNGIWTSVCSTGPKKAAGYASYDTGPAMSAIRSLENVISVDGSKLEQPSFNIILGILKKHIDAQLKLSNIEK